MKSTRVPELAIVVPTFEERNNIEPLLERLEQCLQDHAWEVIFVDDDSIDGTAALVRRLAGEKPQVRCLQRLGRRGLSSACIEGVLATSAPYICIMDADLQHDERLIPAMLETLQSEALDIVVGSRYLADGSAAGLSTMRSWGSRLATWISGLLVKGKVSDPMSGFFMFRRQFFEGTMRALSGRGFKILLDILTSADSPVRVGELPYEMRARHTGKSKLNVHVIWEFFTLIAFRLLGRLIPVRFVSFAMVGFSGVAVHLFTLWIAHKQLLLQFIYAQLIATLVAMTSNFVLNNRLTFSDRRLRGRRFFSGLLSFYGICSIGALINLAVAELLYDNSLIWWAAGVLGAVAGAVWNFGVTSVFTWRHTPAVGHDE